MDNPSQISCFEFKYAKPSQLHCGKKRIHGKADLPKFLDLASSEFTVQRLPNGDFDYCSILSNLNSLNCSDDKFSRVQKIMGRKVSMDRQTKQSTPNRECYTHLNKTDFDTEHHCDSEEEKILPQLTLVQFFQHTVFSLK